MYKNLCKVQIMGYEKEFIIYIYILLLTRLTPFNLYSFWGDMPLNYSKCGIYRYMNLYLEVLLGSILTELLINGDFYASTTTK